MKNKKKKTVKAQALLFSLLLLAALTYSVPAKASDGINVMVRPAYAQVDGKTKNEFQKEYNADKKSIKAEYRKTVNTLKSNLNLSLNSNDSRGERTEARRKFKEGLKSAERKMNLTLKEAKSNYRKQISQ